MSEGRFTFIRKSMSTLFGLSPPLLIQKKKNPNCWRHFIKEAPLSHCAGHESNRSSSRLPSIAHVTEHLSRLLNKVTSASWCRWDDCRGRKQKCARMREEKHSGVQQPHALTWRSNPPPHSLPKRQIDFYGGRLILDKLKLI